MTLRTAFTVPGESDRADAIRAAWSTAGSPTFGDSPLTVSAQFYVADATGDLTAYLDLLLAALTGCLFDDRRQVVCFAGVHRIRTEGEPRTALTAWSASVGVVS